MNWLAHIVLSPDNIESRLGNLLADRLKGKPWPQASDQFLLGMSLHKQIDRFTDSHPQVLQSKQRLRKQGYLKSVVIDVLYDHLLYKHWATYYPQNAKCFLDAFLSQIPKIYTDYPEDIKGFLNRLIKTEHLYHYHSLYGVTRALSHIDSRLSPRLRTKENAQSYLVDIEREFKNLEDDFLIFYPQLKSQCLVWITELTAKKEFNEINVCQDKGM